MSIKELLAASGKSYEIVEHGLRPGIRQYIDRHYTFGPLPAGLEGQTLIRTAGNDKMYEEHELCLSFSLTGKGTVYILHGNTFPERPAWLKEYRDTGEDVARPLADDPRGMSFSVFAREFPAGPVKLWGDLPRGFLTPPFRNNGGAGYCMYSVIVAEI